MMVGKPVKEKAEGVSEDVRLVRTERFSRVHTSGAQAASRPGGRSMDAARLKGAKQTRLFELLNGSLSLKNEYASSLSLVGGLVFFPRRFIAIGNGVLKGFSMRERVSHLISIVYSTFYLFLKSMMINVLEYYYIE
jgi:hypothetical protein